MTLRRMDKTAEATQALVPIQEGMEVIENGVYYDLCLFYKGLKTQEEINLGNSGPGGVALQYGLANWEFYQGNLAKAKDNREDLRCA